jgi:hypothetical protein
VTIAAKAPKTRKPAPKPERHITFFSADSNPALLEMTIGKESFAYFVKKIHADFGMGFEFTKCPDLIGPSSEDVYHVHYDPARRWTRCDCKGGEFNGHCKHQEAILALIQSGKIAVAAPKPEAKPEENRICRECGKPERGCRCGFDDP